MSSPSLRTLSLAFAFAFALLALAPTGCGDASSGPLNSSSGTDTGPLVCAGRPASLASGKIMAGKTLTATAGDGAGVFVEYQAGGHWHVWMTCDTLQTGQDCSFDVQARAASGAPQNARGDALEAGDTLSVECNDTVRLVAMTAAETDGMYFDLAAGAGLQITVILGGSTDPRFIYWYGTYGTTPDAVREGAPADPMDLTPESP